MVCTDFFKDKVDGFLSLSGGRIGGAAPRAANAGPPRSGAARHRRPPARPRHRPAPGPAVAAVAPRPPDPSCDFSHIYTTGEHEIASLPAASAWRRKVRVAARRRSKPTSSTPRRATSSIAGRQNPGTKQWGLLPRPGRREVFVYPKCKDGRVVADVVRIDKGHTEGLEPRVTEELVRMVLSREEARFNREDD